MPSPVAAPAVLHRLQLRPQRAQFRRRVAHIDRPASPPFRPLLRIRQPRPGPRPQRIHQHLLALPVLVRVLPVRARIPLAQAQLDPVRRQIDRAPVQLRIHKRFCEFNGMPPALLPVLAQPPQIQPQHARGQVLHARPLRQHQKARVIGDQMQAPELHRLVPAQPAVARAALEDPRLPAHQRQPLALVFRHIAQPAPGELLEPQIVVFGSSAHPSAAARAAAPAAAPLASDPESLWASPAPAYPMHTRIRPK